VLLALRDSISNWDAAAAGNDNVAGWDANTTVCHWSFVACSPGGRVTRLCGPPPPPRRQLLAWLSRTGGARKHA
jgi:hypothetical protein